MPIIPPGLTVKYVECGDGRWAGPCVPPLNSVIYILFPPQNVSVTHFDIISLSSQGFKPS